MRDMNQILRIVELFERCWLKAPDMSAGQLIENIKLFSGIDDLSHMEDDVFEVVLKEFYKACV